jgi:ATP-dependent exoDNAse (exonuclease V) beta subunit
VSAPPDQDARDRTVRDRDRSLLVEASAGTGKTHAIIEAILEVCVRREPRLPLTRVAAVTFTEKAASELQERLRDRLAGVASSSTESDRDRRNARDGLEELDRAQVGTIHAFCSSLLRERPIEAGLVPNFEMLLPEASTALARLVWEDWWRREAEERPDGALGRALVAGMKITGGQKEFTITALAAALYDKRARLDGGNLPSADARPVLAAAGRLRERAMELGREAAEAKNPAAATLSEIVSWLDALPDDLPAIRALRSSAPTIRFARGWKEASDAIDRWRRKEYTKFLESLPGTESWPILVDLLHRLVDDPGGYLEAVSRRKRRESLLDFDDLLLTARDLLRHSSPARSHFRERYAFIVVDEFQDTDPVQMEIILRLAHAEGGETEWTHLTPQPGRLLLVGDPKQSIYRFRRADLETYSLVRDLMGDDREVFVANRRSVPPILEWINATFSEAMAPPVKPFEAPYSPVDPWDAPQMPAGKRVVYLDPPPDWRAGEDNWRRDEAKAIAAFLADTLERRVLPVGSGERTAVPGDVAVLVRSNEAIGIVQEAVIDAGLDAVIEGGLDFFQREEPAAVLATLRALDNPHDPIALYASLKSFLFALSDEELFLAHEGGAIFDYLRADHASGPLRDALDLLQRLHRDREARPASETIVDLYAATGALVKARARRVGGLQAQANLHQLASLARSLETSAISFASVVRGLESVQNTDASEPRAFEESGDAVRILTVHKAKGLEFPVVVLAGFGSGSRPQSEGLLIPFREGPWAASIRMGTETIASPDYDFIRRADDDRDWAEVRRLLYVGATRARDWFVLSRWRRIVDSKHGTSDAYDRSAIALLGPIPVTPLLDRLVDRRSGSPSPKRRRAGARRVNPAAVETLRREIRELEERPGRLAGTRSAPLRRAGGSHARPEDRPEYEREPASEPSIAARIGCAVHRAMEIVVRGGDRPSAIVRAALEWELGAPRHREIEAMVDVLLRSPLVSSPSRRIAEFPILFRSPEDGALVEGKIDLLVEENGGWRIVDYKTDRVDRLGGAERVRAHFEGYRPQLAEYATALSLIGVPVAGACVLSARTGEAYDLGSIRPVSGRPPSAPRRG